jgi:hypothetical protein
VRHAARSDAVGNQLAHWGFKYLGPEKGWGR